MTASLITLHNLAGVSLVFHLNFLKYGVEAQMGRCIPNGEQCHFTGRMGFCCSNFCLQLGGEPFGSCQPLNVTRETFVTTSTTTGKSQAGSISADTESIVISVSVVLGILVVVTAIAIIFGYKYFRSKGQSRDLTEDEIKEFREGDSKAAERVSDGSEKAWLLPFAENYAIPSTALKIDRDSVLGEGEFGVVWRGSLFNQPVAVKTTKGNAEVDCVKAILKELKIQAYIGKHPHIVEFFGAEISRLRERVVYAVVELSPIGNLLNFLRQNIGNYFHSDELEKVEGVHAKPRQPPLHTYDNVTKTLRMTDLLRWCMQIAHGMEFLANKKVVHGDLAARNVLMFSTELVKISDFGLSRQLYEQAQYVKQQRAPLPWRWMAVESLKFMEFSSQSDVWAFAVTVWEIFSFGNAPFPGLNWTFDFVQDLEAGLRMTKPKFMNQQIYEMLLDCWKLHSQDRPLFKDVKMFFNLLLDQLEKNVKHEREKSYTFITPQEN